MALGAANEVVINAGRIREDASETITWEAIDQISKKSSTIVLPKMFAGDTWLGKKRIWPDISVPPIVDGIEDIAEDTAGISTYE